MKSSVLSWPSMARLYLTRVLLDASTYGDGQDPGTLISSAPNTSDDITGPCIMKGRETAYVWPTGHVLIGWHLEGI